MVLLANPHDRALSRGAFFPRLPADRAHVVWPTALISHSWSTNRKKLLPFPVLVERAEHIFEALSAVCNSEKPDLAYAEMLDLQSLFPKPEKVRASHRTTNLARRILYGSTEPSAPLSTLVAAVMPRGRHAMRTIGSCGCARPASKCHALRRDIMQKGST
jgi:hypothetical protein